MLHSLVLEKERANTSQLPSRAHPETSNELVSSDVHDFVYMVIPMAQGYRVMRAPLERFLAIAEPVSEIPRGEAASEASLIAENEASVQSRTRRVHLVDAKSPAVEQSNVSRFANVRARFGSVEIDGAARVVTKAGKQVSLAPLEFDLLLALYIRNGAAVSRQDLLREVWTGRDGVTSRTVDTHVFNLRRKLEKSPARPEHLLTVSKVGYRLKA